MPRRPFSASLWPLGLSLRHMGLGLACLALPVLAGCWWQNAPTRLNAKIDAGDAAEALTRAEEQLAESPTSTDAPQWALVAAKARIALCVQRACTMGVASNTLPPLLVPLNTLLAQAANAQIPGKDKKTPPLTTPAMLTWAMAQFETLPNQPFPMLTLANAAPTRFQPQLKEGFFAPALTASRQGRTALAADILLTLAASGPLAEPLPTFSRFAAHTLGGNPANTQPYLIALRSAPVNTPLPHTAAALLPWALLAQSQAAASPSTPLPMLLGTLPDIQKSWQLTLLKSPAIQADMGAEFARAATRLSASWQQDANPVETRLALQRLALTANPNQPALWVAYLKDLVQNAPRPKTAAPVSGTAALVSGAQPAILAAPNLLTSGFMLTALTSNTARQLGDELLTTARQLQTNPAVAVPLLVLANQLPLSNPQQVQFDKLSQDLMIKAAEARDIPTTLAVAQIKTQVAQNNRHIVVPLLVQGIRANLQAGHFDEATTMADTLTQSLKLNIEYGPIILEEFTADLHRRGIMDDLAAATPAELLQPQEDVVLNLGPLFAFMQTHFALQPDVLNSQLTNLVAQAGGTYGPATAMYRLGPSFPSSTMPATKQQEWLATAITAAMVEDNAMPGPTMVQVATRMAALHPGFTMAPVIEAAVRKTPSLDDQRELWANSTPEVRQVLQAIRPQFESLMRGIDAMEHGHLTQAAEAFEGLADPQTRQLAAPYLEQFLTRLANLSGIYVPAATQTLALAGTITPAALILTPAALNPGTTFSLNSVSVTVLARIGRAAITSPETYRTSRAEAPQLTLAIPFQFDTSTLALTPDVLAQSPQGLGMANIYGTIRSIQAGKPGSLNVTFANGKTHPFTRVLANTETPLFPNGVYLLSKRLGAPVSDTATILPPGTLVQLNALPMPRPPVAADDAPAGATTIYPVTGRVQHPASSNALPLEGTFDPRSLTTTFTFSYPLPQSARPVKAAVRCQTLAGTITCGAHHTHSPRDAYATLTAGLETKESLTANSAFRRRLNTVAVQAILASATTPQTIASVSETTPSTSAPTPVPSVPTPAGVPSAMPEVSSTTPSTTVPTSSTEPTTIPAGAFVRRTASGTEIITSTTPTSPTAPSGFIHRLSTSTTPLF